MGLSPQKQKVYHIAEYTIGNHVLPGRVGGAFKHDFRSDNIPQFDLK